MAAMRMILAPMPADRAAQSATFAAFAGPLGLGGGMPFVVLGSTSPRRRELLKRYGILHYAVSPGLDDAELLAPGHLPVKQWVMSLAMLKASAAGRELAREPFAAEYALALQAAAATSGSAVLVAADTIVVKGERQLGKPRNAADARAMIRLLADTDHQVLTGVAMMDLDTRVRRSFVDSSEVQVGPLSDEQIEAYVATGRWAGKAGAYNLEEQVAAGWPITWQGEATSVMGLPMRRLVEQLGKWRG